jgi:hypothetical protein
MGQFGTSCRFSLFTRQTSVVFEDGRPFLKGRSGVFVGPGRFCSRSISHGYGGGYARLVLLTTRQTIRGVTGVTGVTARVWGCNLARNRRRGYAGYVGYARNRRSDPARKREQAGAPVAHGVPPSRMAAVTT